MSELEKVISNVSIALRKGKCNLNSHIEINAAIKSEDSLKKLLEFDDGYRFLKLQLFGRQLRKICWPVRDKLVFQHGSVHFLQLICDGKICLIVF